MSGSCDSRGQEKAVFSRNAWPKNQIDGGKNTKKIWAGGVCVGAEEKRKP